MAEGMLRVQTRARGLRLARMAAWFAGWAAGRVRILYRIEGGEWRELAGVTIQVSAKPFERGDTPPA